MQGIIIPHDTYSARVTSRWMSNYGYRGVALWLYIEEQPTTESEFILFIDAQNPARMGPTAAEAGFQRLNDQDWVKFTHETNLGTVAHYLLICYPGADDQSGKGHLITQSMPLPPTWRVRTDITGAPWKFGVGYAYLR